MAKIEVLNREVQILTIKEDDYICLTDIARYKNQETSDDLIRNWLRNRNTIEFLGIWEQINNPVFNPVEFDGIKMLAGLSNISPFVLSLSKDELTSRTIRDKGRN